MRARRPDDETSLTALVGEIDRHHAEALPHVFRAAFAARGVGEAGPFDTAREIFVAEIGGRVEGFVDVRVRDVPENSITAARTIGYVSRLVVARTSRRRGAGRALMLHSTEWLRERGCATIELGVHEFNAGARALYDSLGYETVIRTLEKRLNR